MPIYEYKCPKCSEVFEELVFNDKIPPCPKCGSNVTDKVMSCACVRTTSGSGGSSCGSCTGGNCGSCGC